MSANPAPAIREGYARIDDQLTLHYRRSGHGPTTIVLVPGWTMTTEVYEHQLAHFAESERYSALAYDPRSHGLSTTTWEGHSYRQHARDLEALLRSLAVDRYILVGWSAAGAAILEHVSQFGDGRLAGLVMLDSAPRGHTEDRREDWAWFGTCENGDQDGEFELYSLLPLEDRERVTAALVEWMLDERSAANAGFVRSMSLQTPSLIAAQLNTSLWFFDGTDALASLDGRLPLLYFCREDVKNTVVTWAAARTPTAVVESHGRHMSFWEHPEVFNAALGRFLERV